MDTNFLTPMAYEILPLANKVHSALMSVIGASASDYPNEATFLAGTLFEIEMLILHPEEYLEDWDDEEGLTEEVFRERLFPLRAHIIKTIATRYRERGKPEFDRGEDL